MMFQLYKKRSFGDMISDTFTFLKITGKHFFKNYFAVTGIFLLVFLVLAYFVSKVYFDFIFASANSSFEDNPMEHLFGNNIAMIVGVFILFLLLLILISLLNYSFPITYFRLYEKHNYTTNFTSKDIVNEMKSTFGKLIVFFLITILIGILFFILMMAMFSIAAVVSPFLVLFVMIPIFVIIPIVYIWISQTLYYQMNTNIGIFASLVQGWNSMTSKFWSILGSTVIIYIIIVILTNIVSMIPYMIGMMSVFGAGTTDPFQNTDSMSFFGIMLTISMILSMLVSFIMYNLLFINQGLIYYGTVEQKENRTPQSEIDLIGVEE